MTYSPNNSLSRTPSIAQISAYILVVVQSCIFYIMVAPKFHSESAKTAFIVLYTIFTVILITAGTICSCIDPSDSVMVDCKKGNSQQYANTLDQLMYCEHCNSYVKRGSRHCRKCDRCTQMFDHHCIWINNCIGCKNYKPFLVMIFSVCLQMITFIVSIILLAIEDQWKQLFMGQMITSFVFMGIIGIFCILDLNLVLLHIYLCCNGYTTYQFLMQRRQNQRIEQEEKRRLSQISRQQSIKQTLEKQKQHLQKRYQSLKTQRNNSATHSKKKIHPLEPPTQDISRHEKINSTVNIKVKEFEIEHTPIQKMRPIQSGAIDHSSPSESSSKKSIFEVQSQQSIQSFNSKSRKINDEKNEINSSASDIKINKFFLKNKSFNIFMDNDEAVEPRPINQTVMIEKQSMSKSSNKNQLYNSLKVISNQDNNSMKKKQGYLPKLKSRQDSNRILKEKVQQNLPSPKR